LVDQILGTGLFTIPEYPDPVEPTVEKKKKPGEVAKPTGAFTGGYGTSPFKGGWGTGTFKGGYGKSLYTPTEERKTELAKPYRWHPPMSDRARAARARGRRLRSAAWNRMVERKSSPFRSSMRNMF
jgi:hypothetical protein